MVPTLLLDYCFTFIFLFSKFVVALSVSDPCGKVIWVFHWIGEPRFVICKHFYQLSGYNKVLTVTNKDTAGRHPCSALRPWPLCRSGLLICWILTHCHTRGHQHWRDHISHSLLITSIQLLLFTLFKATDTEKRSHAAAGGVAEGKTAIKQQH